MGSYLQAILLGAVESLTEYLPISSTGHLILMSDVLGFVSEGDVFQVVIQVGAALSVCVFYFDRFRDAVLTLRSDPGSRRFAVSVIVAFLPAAVIGVFFHGFIKSVLFSPVVVACALIVGGFAILVVERWRPTPRLFEADRLPFKTALAIGFFQVLSLVPGVSRSGATILGALLVGLDRKAAAEFSFFLAVPTIFGAAVYDGWQNRHAFTWDDAGLIAVGTFAAFVFGLLVVKGLLGYVQRYTFRPFGWYRIVLGLIVLGAVL